jgi:hypothetical protein
MKNEILETARKSYIMKTKEKYIHMDAGRSEFEYDTFDIH